jgi:hypothetical protein
MNCITSKLTGHTVTTLYDQVVCASAAGGGGGGASQADSRRRSAASRRPEAYRGEPQEASALRWQLPPARIIGPHAGEAASGRGTAVVGTSLEELLNVLGEAGGYGGGRVQW